MKRLLALLTGLTLALAGLTACNESDSSKSQSSNDSETSTSSTESKVTLSDVSNWLTGEIWNDAFCNIKSYIDSGTSATGEEMDIDFTISNLKTSMEKKDEYSKFIEGLEDEKYTELKEVWTKLSEQIDVLYNQVIENTPVANDSSSTFSTDLFKQYFDKFYNLSYELMYE